MPQIFDNVTLKLIEGLEKAFDKAVAASFCIGYLNLRGWDQVAGLVETLQGGDEDHACRVLVGMYRPPDEEMRALASLRLEQEASDGPTRSRLKFRIQQIFKEQLSLGVPSASVEQALRGLAAQLRARKVFVKAFLQYPLHAKLYLVQRDDPVAPLVGFVGSSNLTLAGLSRQGELNVDVVEQDAAKKLQAWFDERWGDELAVDLSDKLATLIETSWARSKLVRPYLVYLKIAYHLSEEAGEEESRFRAPQIFAEKGTPLLNFQEKAVSLAIHHLHRRGGVLLGDVVGLGKTLMATAIARVLQEDDDSNTLVICPPKLLPMWEQYLQDYEITGKVLSLGKCDELSHLRRYRLVIIDESHNLRNRKGKRYQAIQEYIERNDARVLLLTATPYNKQFTDLSNQLRLFLDENEDLHIRPERFFQQWIKDGKTEADFIAQFGTSPSSLLAFEKSPFPEDWRDLMRLYLVRRTRHFIMKNYAEFDETRRRYFVRLNGEPKYFPVREPRRVSFKIDENDPSDQYARLFRDDVVQIIEQLVLPRYGMAQFLIENADRLANEDQKRILDNLNRAGKRLIGFCRTNLFKRLESSGHSFLLSVNRHILRNLIALHALRNGLPIPIGTQDPAMLDTAINDADDELIIGAENDDPTAVDAREIDAGPVLQTATLAAYQALAAKTYKAYATKFRTRFDWLDPKFFQPELANVLENDAQALFTVLEQAGPWNPDADAKLTALVELLTHHHPKEKVLIFTQFADTARYLHKQLAKRGITDLGVATSEIHDPVSLARRFSPSTNGGLRNGETELRVLVGTDVLAEGLNLQDAHIVVNYDLPWAIIRLIQRAGRVDRIGQKHDTILVYSFLPADGVDRIINLRTRLFRRLQENQEVIGTDESFFGEDAATKLRDLYTEKAGTLDDDQTDDDIDLVSLALQVWNSASPEDKKAALSLPANVFATRALPETADPSQHPPGVIAYLRFPHREDTLVRVDEHGNLVSQSLSSIFRAAACAPDTPPLPRSESHHDLVARCVEIVTQAQISTFGLLGPLRGVRRKLYERLDRYRQLQQEHPTSSSDEILERLDTLIDLIYRYPLKRAAQDPISRQIRLGIPDDALLELVWRHAEDKTLCEITEEDEASLSEPQIICSIGLVNDQWGENSHE